MTESPYAIPEEELVTSARVPVEQQVVEQAGRRFFGGDGASGPLLCEDTVDADGG